MPKTFIFLYQSSCCTADILSNADAINKDKEFTENIGSIDRLRNENIELNKLNETMKKTLLKPNKPWKRKGRKTRMPSVM